jgi:hypothetical protein
MLHDHEVRRQLARERADQLARAYRAQPASRARPAVDQADRAQPASLAARLLRRKVERAPAAGA